MCIPDVIERQPNINTTLDQHLELAGERLNNRQYCYPIIWCASFKHVTLNQRCSDADPPPATMAQHLPSNVSMSRNSWDRNSDQSSICLACVEQYVATTLECCSQFNNVTCLVVEEVRCSKLLHNPGSGTMTRQ